MTKTKTKLKRPVKALRATTPPSAAGGVPLDLARMISRYGTDTVLRAVRRMEARGKAVASAAV